MPDRAHHLTVDTEDLQQRWRTIDGGRLWCLNQPITTLPLFERQLRMSLLDDLRSLRYHPRVNVEGIRRHDVAVLWKVFWPEEVDRWVYTSVRVGSLVPRRVPGSFLVLWYRGIEEGLQDAVQPFLVSWCFGRAVVREEAREDGQLAVRLTRGRDERLR